MTWKVKADRDAFKEAWLCFENDRGRFPLYPGQAATVSYSCTVDDGRRGPWLQRAVRPEEADEAEGVITELFAALQRASEQHVFSKGMGIAAPQVGIGRADATVMPPDPSAEPVVMLNPVIVSESAEEDEQCEGCLSFFDVRGLVPRPLRTEVACSRPDGQLYILALDNAIATSLRVAASTSASVAWNLVPGS